MKCLACGVRNAFRSGYCLGCGLKVEVLEKIRKEKLKKQAEEKLREEELTKGRERYAKDNEVKND